LIRIVDTLFSAGDAGDDGGDSTVRGVSGNPFTDDFVGTIGLLSEPVCMVDLSAIFGIVSWLKLKSFLSMGERDKSNVTFEIIKIVKMAINGIDTTRRVIF
jgi:hypothetical protein